MGKVASYNSHDYVSGTPVPVIASFDSTGHIAPLYVRLSGASYRIHSYWVKSSCVNVTQFNCQVLADDAIKPLMLNYFQDEAVWIAMGQGK